MTKAIKTAKNGAKAAPVIFTASAIAETIDETPIDRDERGQFVTGHNGGPGRPPGSKNKLSEDFVSDVLTIWHESGIAALRTMVKDEPGAFIRCVAGLMPRDILLEARGAGICIVKLSDEDMAL